MKIVLMWKYRYDSQQKILLNVGRSLSKGQDAIDIMLQREDDNIHVCGYCLEVNEKGNYPCLSCSVSFKTFRGREELYENVPSCHSEKTYQIRRNYRCEPKFLRNSKASFIKFLGTGRGTTKKEIGVCRF